MIKQLWFYFLLLVYSLLNGCDSPSPEYREYIGQRSQCLDDSHENLSAFVLQCIKNANPKSDEEPEDWIYICRNMGKEIFCPDKTFQVKQVRLCRECPWSDSEINEISDKAAK
ncbi:hypothetical protein KA005_72245 [bacterium]|nr:hypothetical protein [bacterium]